MQAFLDSSVFEFLWKTLCIMIAIVILKFIISSGIQSLKKPGSKIFNLLDEFIMGVTVFAGAIAILMMPPSTIFNYISNILLWIYQTIIVPLLALLGINL